MGRIKVSVIVPVFNREDYIIDCIESLISQTYDYIEIILVDDGSTDRSGILCDNYAGIDNRIKVIHKTNGGHQSARNAGLICSSGDYITYVDSDDWVDKDYIEKLIEGVEQFDADIVIAAGYMNEAENGVTKVFAKLPSGFYSGDKLLNFFYSHMLSFSSDCLEYGVHPFMCNKLFKRSIISQVQLSAPIDIVKGEDVMCTYPCLLMADKIAVLSISSYHYRRWNGSITMQKTFESIEDLVFRHNCIKKQFEKVDFSEAIKNQFYIYYWHNLCQQALELLFDVDFDMVPYDIKRGDKVVIYGMGENGKRVEKILSSFCDIVALTETRPIISNEKVIYPIQLLDTEYDKVIIAVKAKRHLDEITQVLKELGIEDSKISTLNYVPKYMNYIDKIIEKYQREE